MAHVSIKNLVKEYPLERKKTFPAVKGIDLEIPDREFMVLVGPSGCGKSTTMRMIAGLEEITGGTISIDGRVVNDVAPKDRDIAMVFQNYALYPHMTVYENMSFGLKLMKYPKSEIRQRVGEAAEILGLSSMLERKPKALSGGQRQRVALGRAIVRKPKVFLFDEPLSNLDAKMRVQMRTEISKLHNRLEATMIYVTHDQVEAMTMGDRICVMKNGEIMQVDGPLKLYNDPQNMFVAGFIGSPPMNVFTGMIEGGDGGLSFVERNEKAAPFRLCLDDSLSDRVEDYVGKAIVLGIRPEHISEVPAEAGQTAHTLRVRVDVSEPMGAETYLYFDTGAHTFIARVHSDHVFEAGHEVTTAFDMARVKFFDPETEHVIG